MRRIGMWIWGLYRWAVGRPVHCWADKADWSQQRYGWSSDEWAAAFLNNATCFRLHGHFGAHEWVPDSEVSVEFPEREADS